MSIQVVGLTGGIACGKSTVAGFLREMGVPVVDADEVARVVVEPGRPAHAQIVLAFGPEVVDAAGRIDRARLGATAFADPAARETLEAITHPQIVAESAKRFAALGEQGERVAAYEAALLVETGRWRDFAALVVVTCPPDEQRRRLVARGGIGKGGVEARLAAQMPTAEKEKVADAVIVNDGDLETARSRTRQAWSQILKTIGAAR